MTAHRPHRRRMIAGLTPIALALGALPLLAPTCGDTGEGYKTFARNSIIIPMDVCYQYQTDGIHSSYTPAAGPACPQPDPGDVIKAYGLVYELIRNDIAVYWIIDGQKTALEGIDLTVQYDGGLPVVFYDWSPENPPPTAAPTAGHAIDYRGGPFVVDGSDYARASAVLQQRRSTFSNVNVHISNVAFRAYAKKTMAGGWSAGGSVAPKVALLDIGSTSGSYAKNSEPIIRGYLARAGLDFAGAGGVATATGHGQIYDRLGMADFQPTAGGDWTTTNLYKYGYQILWVPHWFAPGSCSDTSGANDTERQTNCTGSQYPDAQVAAALQTIGAFVASGKDLFAECAGLGSFEGVTGNASYGNGDPSTHFQEETGLDIHTSVGTSKYVPGNFSSPLMQLGDWPFIPDSGAIGNYKPVTAPYRPGVQELVEDQADPAYDYFTILPAVSGQHGTVVYLGGHVYSGYFDTLGTGGTLQNDFPNFEIGGTRLVLNTLFNLGATCTASGVACNTGQPGICAAGTLVCQSAQPVCAQTATPTAEICNGLDDDCDWEVDEGLTVQCYDGPTGTKDVGMCRAGVSSCVRSGTGTYGMSACTGQVVPTTEVCNALDDDCDGSVDEGLTQTCYEGPPSSIDPLTSQPRGICQKGTRTCSMGSWGACDGQVLPRAEICNESGTALDDDCDGVVNNNCGCTVGETRACYSGPAGTSGIGICKAGIQTCVQGPSGSGYWEGCAVCPAGIQPSDPAYASCQILPATEVCGNAVDENCDTLKPACPECITGDSRACYPGNAGDVRDSSLTQCRSGAQACVAESWGGCLGANLPSSFEACDAIDNDCNGIADDNAVCPTLPTPEVCEHGVCVPDACGTELPPPEGYVCIPGADPNGKVVLGLCGSRTVPCADGEVCQYGSCVSPCQAGQCAAGSVCGGGACVAGGCYSTGCTDPAAPLCLNGVCEADPCNGLTCPSGTFCRRGDCVQACAFVTCGAGQKCGIDGFCEQDPCTGKTCGPGQRCDAGACAANPCANKGCATGQVCDVGPDGTAVCVDDPCTGIGCPVGKCGLGQCYPTSAGTATSPTEEKAAKGCGCGSGSGAALPALLTLLAVPLARRRKPRRGGALALLAVAAALLGAACKDKPAPFDPSACAETCGEQRCVDLQTDPVHCGTSCAAAVVCGAGEICVDAHCGPASSVAPFIASISPASGPRGAATPITVQLTGERFQSGATVRVISAAGTRTYPASFADAGHVSVDLDLSAATAATWQLRVVNPDKVISNAVPFDVVMPFPALTEIQPAVVTAGIPSTVLAVGTGLTSTTLCRIRSTSAGVPETTLSSTLEAGGLRCIVGDNLGPGAYELWVVNEGGPSNVKTLTVVSQTATLTDVSPSFGPENQQVSLTITGTGFDVSSRVLFDGCAGPSDPAGCPHDAVSVGTTYVSPTRLVAALTLPVCGIASCDHQISVRNGNGATTGTFFFTVRKDSPSIAFFTPATAYQGNASVTLTFTGSGFPAGTTIEVQPPGGAFGDVTVSSGAVSCTSSCTVSGTMSLVAQPEGDWLARLQYPSMGASEAWPFRVLSSQAILQDASPRSGPQGTSRSVTLQVANLLPPYGDVRVVFRGPGFADRLFVPAPAPTTPTSPLTVTLDLAGLPTGTCSLAVKNLNATDSNALSFAVTPGAPTLAAVSPSSYAQSSANPLVTVTLTGTNFAAPDANGNGGSVVHIKMIAIDGSTVVPDTALPASSTTVESPTTIKVALDVRDGIPGAYDVQVWNPALATDPTRTPQKSEVLADAFTIQ